MQRGLSPEQVAEVLDIAPADLAQIERGALDLDLDRVAQIADALQNPALAPTSGTMHMRAT